MRAPRCRSTEANKYSQQELLLMKTQDAKYLGLKSRTEAAVSHRYAWQALLLPCQQSLCSLPYTGLLAAQYIC